jgi:hypothetical protein
MPYAPVMPTRPTRQLSNPTRERIVRAAVALVAADAAHRAALLAQLPPMFVNSLPRSPSADAQVRQDLRALETGGGVGLNAFVGDPLAIWLEAGNVLGGAGWEGQAFRDGYTELTGRRLFPPSAAVQEESVVAPPTPPSSLGIPLRSLIDLVVWCGVCYGLSWLIMTLLEGR